MRYLILILLVVVLPAGVYWAVNGMAGPAETWERFVGQVDDIRRSQPDEPEPEPEPEPKKDQPEKEPEEKPRTPADVQEEPPKPRADPDKLFRAGQYAQAAEAYDDSQPRARALAKLGIAFAEAFPEPTESYLVLRLKGGGTQEGYALTDGAEIKLLDPTGRAIAIPKALVVGRRRLEPSEVAERALPRINKEVDSGDARRLFRGTAAAFRIGRPDLAAPLLNKIVEADASTVLRAISKDVSELARDPLFRAYSTAVITRAPRPKAEVVVRTEPKNPSTRTEPKRDNPLKLDGSKKSTGRNSKFTVTDEKAKEYMVQARPLRVEGKRLYDKIYGEGLDKASVADVEDAIRKYEAALALYEKALEREDDDTIYVLVTGCSKKLFQLRFWKEQLTGR